MTDEPDWCVIYVTGVDSEEALAEIVAASTGGVVRNRLASGKTPASSSATEGFSQTRTRKIGRFLGRRSRGLNAAPAVTTPGGIEIDVTTNSSNPRFEREPADETDFNRWPYLLEVDEVSEREGVLLLSTIPRGLWDDDISAVAACAFEHLLPRSGGWRDGRLITSDE